MSLRWWGFALGVGVALVAAPGAVAAEPGAREAAAQAHHGGAAPMPSLASTSTDQTGEADGRSEHDDRAPHHDGRDGCCPSHSCCASLEDAFAPWVVPTARLHRVFQDPSRATSPDLVRPRFLLPLSLAPPGSV